MRNFLTIVFSAFVLLACTRKQDKTKFTVTGTIHNNKSTWVYLEMVPPETMQAKAVDSAKLEKDGGFTLHGDRGETFVYNIRLDKQQYPVASVINDTDLVKLDITMSAANAEFAEKYTVTGSNASKQMKDYMLSVNNDLQKIFVIASQGDSLQKAGASDSLLMQLGAEHKALTDKVKDYTLTSLDQAVDPALVLLEVGYYQAAANASGIGLQGLTSNEVNGIISKAIAKWPDHKSLSSISKALASRESQAADESQASSAWVGKKAPEFTLPDVNGKPVSLSSFKGKYVLLDFWASWCQPCRMENPNVVSAFNQYKTKNFTVLGVSLDRPGQKDKWVEAIMQDKLTWTHVSDLQYWSSPVVALYGIQGIPFNLLLDPQGNVIAQDLRGPELSGKLGEVLR